MKTLFLTLLIAFSFSLYADEPTLTEKLNAKGVIIGGSEDNLAPEFKENLKSVKFEGADLVINTHKKIIYSVMLKGFMHGQSCDELDLAKTVIKNAGLFNQSYNHKGETKTSAVIDGINTEISCSDKSLSLSQVRILGDVALSVLAPETPEKPEFENEKFRWYKGRWYQKANSQLLATKCPGLFGQGYRARAKIFVNGREVIPTSYACSKRMIIDFEKHEKELAYIDDLHQKNQNLPPSEKKDYFEVEKEVSSQRAAALEKLGIRPTCPQGTKVTEPVFSRDRIFYDCEGGNFPVAQLCSNGLTPTLPDREDYIYWSTCEKNECYTKEHEMKADYGRYSGACIFCEVGELDYKETMTKFKSDPGLGGGFLRELIPLCRMAKK